MKELQYPSLELCRCLTESNFPETEKFMDYKGRIYENWAGEHITFAYQCPSISELLDELPSVIQKWKIEYWFDIFKKEDCQYISFDDDVLDPLIICDWMNSLPDNLANLYLWLKTNNLLPK